MKRKRGKKSKSKKPAVAVAKDPDKNVAALSTEDNSGVDDNDKKDMNTGMDIETPSSTGTDQLEKPAASFVSGGRVDRPAGGLVYNRVKVKIKSSKALESQVTSSDALTQSDNDKSIQHMEPDKQVVVSDRKEDSTNSQPESSMGVPVNQPKKAGSIKIKSKGFSSSSLSPCNNAGLVQIERTHQKEIDLPRRDSQYSKQELDAALEVIKKIMKMEAAEPFNVPVNPVALGIPDYFDVIDTPMDFGTICSNLEKGLKYMNSEDVYKDVQYIWENCYKYNNKGDYILELLKKVKKNFSKYWTAAGLYSEHQQSTSGVESSHGKEVIPSNHGKVSAKGGQWKHKTRKRHGVKKHKDDCLCAICVMMRRRLEKEESALGADDQTEGSDGLVQEVKLEVTSKEESPCGEDTSSMDNSLDQDVHADEDKGEDMKLDGTNELHSHLQGVQGGEKDETQPQAKEEDKISEHSQLAGRSGAGEPFDTQMVESAADTQKDVINEEKSMQHEEETAAAEHQKLKESQDIAEKAKIYEKLQQQYENPAFLELFGTLFAENPKSLWSGPHSLVQRHVPGRTSSIHSAIATFMK